MNNRNHKKREILGQNSSWKSKSLDLCLTMLSLQKNLGRHAGETGVIGNHLGMTKLKWWPQKEKTGQDSSHLGETESMGLGSGMDQEGK